MVNPVEHLVMRAQTPAGTGWGRVASSLAAIASVTLGAMFAAWFASRPDFGVLTATGLFLASVIGGILLAQASFDLEGLFEQRGRDITAEKIKIASQSGTPLDEPFILYLRPFASTDEIAQQVDRFVNVGIATPGAARFVMATDRIEFEAQIEKALRPFGTMVGLGRPLEHIGAGRILVEEDGWQDLIADLMVKARLIVLLPSSRGGTSWEIDRILSHKYLEKTLVVDPPNDAGAPRSDYDSEAEWNAVRSAFAAHGHTLPPDEEDGHLIWFRDSDMPVRIESAPLQDTHRIRKFVRDILYDIEPQQSSGHTAGKTPATA